MNGTPALRDQDWTRWRIKDTQKGPMVWEVKHVLLTPKDENGLPAECLHLIVARNVRDIGAYEILREQRPGGNASEGTLACGLLAVARGTLF